MIRIGVVSYHNTLPLAHELEAFVDDALIVRATPGDIAEGLAAGSLDVGLVPVAALARHPEWGTVPGLGIGSRGRVDSVAVLSDEPLDGVRRLVEDPASRTSNVLARLWLEQRLERRLEVVRGRRKAADRLGPGDAAVVIGDAALFWDRPVRTRIDLGEAWTTWTGLPFVYAMWAGPAATSPGLAAALGACLDRNLERLTELATVAEPGDGARRERVLHYLAERICYRLDDRDERGLREYFTRGHAAGLLPEVPMVHHHADVR